MPRISGVGLFLVQNTRHGLQVAVFTTGSGRPRLLNMAIAIENDFAMNDDNARAALHRSLATKAQVVGFDPGAVIQHLTLMETARGHDDSIRTEYSFAVQPENHIQCGGSIRWCSIDEFVDKFPRSFVVREAATVLECLEEHYKVITLNTSPPSPSLRLTHTARAIVCEANRPDLLFGVVVRGLRYYEDAARDSAIVFDWFRQRRIDWLLRQDHPRTTTINQVLALAESRVMIMDAFNYSINYPSRDWVVHMTTTIDAHRTMYTHIFGEAPFRFEALVWRMIALCLCPAVSVWPQGPHIGGVVPVEFPPAPLHPTTVVPQAVYAQGSPAVGGTTQPVYARVSPAVSYAFAATKSLNPDMLVKSGDGV